ASALTMTKSTSTCLRSAGPVGEGGVLVGSGPSSRRASGSPCAPNCPFPTVPARNRTTKTPRLADKNQASGAAGCGGHHGHSALVRLVCAIPTESARKCQRGELSPTRGIDGQLIPTNDDGLVIATESCV